MNDLGLQWRPMREEDRNYILSAWLRSYAEGPEFCRLFRGTFFALYQPIVEDLLARSTVAVAYFPDLPDTVAGFLVVEGDSVLHYIHTRRRFRREGIGRWMTKDMARVHATYTHQPSAIALRLCGPDWTYDPMRRFERRAA